MATSLERGVTDPDAPGAGSSGTRPGPGRHDLLTALAALPTGQRAVIVLRYFDDLSEAQTAEVLGCSVGTVKSQNARALTALRTSRVLAATEGELR